MPWKYREIFITKYTKGHEEIQGTEVHKYYSHYSAFVFFVLFVV